MGKANGGDVPPSEVTVKLTVPAVAVRLAGTTAVRIYELTRVVTRGVDPQYTTAVGSK
jgi:hypothetical protein